MANNQGNNQRNKDFLTPVSIVGALILAGGALFVAYNNSGRITDLDKKVDSNYNILANLVAGNKQDMVKLQNGQKKLKYQMGGFRDAVSPVDNVTFVGYDCSNVGHQFKEGIPGEYVLGDNSFNVQQYINKGGNKTFEGTNSEGRLAGLIKGCGADIDSSFIKVNGGNLLNMVSQADLNKFMKNGNSDNIVIFHPNYVNARQQSQLVGQKATRSVGNSGGSSWTDFGSTYNFQRK